MASVRDCAVLAFDVYDRTGNSAATGAGWTRLDPANWSYGFAAGQYRRRDQAVVAYRGTDTDDSRDIIADAVMVPLARPGAGTHTLRTLLTQYGVDKGGLYGLSVRRCLSERCRTPMSAAWFAGSPTGFPKSS